VMRARAHRHDAGLRGGPQQRQQFGGEQKRGEVIDGPLRLKAFKGERLPVGESPGVVDQRVEPPSRPPDDLADAQLGCALTPGARSADNRVRLAAGARPQMSLGLTATRW
jgi:hypothetical protein